MVNLRKDEIKEGKEIWVCRLSCFHKENEPPRIDKKTRIEPRQARIGKGLNINTGKGVSIWPINFEGQKSDFNILVFPNGDIVCPQNLKICITKESCDMVYKNIYVNLRKQLRDYIEKIIEEFDLGEKS